MLIVGLTGGIASGKSTASQYFESLGVPVIDADVIARQLVLPGKTALKQIGSRFGNHILNGDGQLDRAALRQIVFNDASARLDLEAILHPLIRTEIQHQIDALNAPYCILAIPLLIETEQTDLVNRVLVIDSDESLQYQRLQQRDHLDVDTIKAIIQTQASREQRLTAADDIVRNNGSVADLHRQLKQYHQHYLQTARRH